MKIKYYFGVNENGN